MAHYTSLLLLCVGFVLADGQNDNLLTPCRMDDIECIRTTSQQFLENTANGIPKLGVTPIDPLTVDKLDYDLPEFKTSHHVRNLTITGLKNLQVTNFQMDTTAKTVTVTQNISVAALGDIDIDYHVEPTTKTVKGRFSSDFKFVATVRYPYSMTQDDKGVTHFNVGKETVEFQMIGIPKYELSKEFLDAVNADPQLAAMRNNMLATQREQLAAAILKQLVDVIVSTFINNVRQSATHLPASAFFITE